MTAATAPNRTVRITAPSRAYDAVVGPGTLGSIGERSARLFPGVRRATVVVDRGAEQFGRAVISALKTANLTADPVITLSATERDKSLHAAGRILEAMTAARFERAEPLIVIGGGIVGDVAGFAAATYRRGVPWVYCPTTLLAMVDASVGGKTAVNISAGGGLRKNMAGAFHQPSLVVADTDAVNTLPPRIFRCGLAECVKHAVIAGSAEFKGETSLLAWTQSNIDRILAQDAAALAELVARNITVKARFVEQDEREELGDADGGRTLLNLGHTFAHAIETIPDLSPDADPAHAPLQHGEAVALGLVAACACAEHPSLALTDAKLGRRVRAMFARIGLPTEIAALPPTDAVYEAMHHDKKVAGGRLRLVLPDGMTGARVFLDPPRMAVEAAIDAIRAGASASKP